jgi:SAM-dependent methyltransferase
MDKISRKSPRVEFQWKYFEATTRAPDGALPNVLNIGCANDPIDLEDGAFHFDMDDWTYKHKWFRQGDAHNLPFGDKSFMCVILGDILEHVVDPLVVTQEAARVTAIGGILVLTVFEEWRLPGPGQWIEESHKIADEENVKMGYEDREHYQRDLYPERIGVDDDEVPHLSHINQFDDSDMVDMINWLILPKEFTLLEASKVREENHEGHDWFNWLIAFRRIK